jgi:hypothetical protein
VSRTVEYGVILNVDEEIDGSVLTSDAATDDTVLYVDDTTDFEEEGGDVIIDEVIYEYTAVDDEAGTITLATGLLADAAAETYVDITPSGDDRIATVRIDNAHDEGEYIEAPILHSLFPFLAPGARDQRGGEQVKLRDDGSGWIVVDVLGQVPVPDPEILQPPGGGGGTGSLEALGRASVEAAPLGADDEEFTEDLGGLTVEVQRSGDTNSWAVKHERALYVNTDTPGGNGDMHAILKAVALSVGDYIECAVEFTVDKVYFGPALVISDGAAFGSGKQAVVCIFSPGSTWTSRIENRSNWSSTAAQGGDFDYSTPRYAYLRLKYEATDTFRGYYSIDGKTWQDIGSLTISMTPSHIGIAAYHFNASSPVSGWLQYHNFRVNPADD